MESIVCDAANKVVEYTFGVIKRGFVYVIYVDSNVQNLKEKVQNLMHARERVRHDVDGAKRNAEEIEEDVLKWMADVDEKLTEAGGDKLKEDEEKAKKKCFIGLCPNFKCRYQLSKKAEEEAQAIVQLLGEGKFDKVSYSVAPEAIINKGYDAFESRTSAMEEIMNALRQSSVPIVGIHGMAGVGKSTLAKEVARKVREERLFDEVAMAVVSHNPVIRQIQGEIADILGLKFDVETDGGRAMHLRKRINNGKRILIILDDLWQKLDLEAVGISFDNEAAQKSSIAGVGISFDNVAAQKSSIAAQKSSTAGCKILLTSRSLDVLRLMDAERSFEVKILSQKESKILFENIVGEAVGKSDDYQRIADELVEKCAGLPVAILAIANTLKRRDLPHWKDALRQLQRSISSSIKGVKDDVHYTIELSYRWLIKEEAQSLFLLCGLHPQGFDILVSDLLQYCIGLDMLKGIKTVEEARERIDVLVDMLKDSSLLLKGKDNEWVKMHDLIRDVSLSIASKDKRMLVIEDENRMKELLKKGKPNDCTAISLLYSNIHELSRVERSKLELLMLLNKDSSFQISDTFFEGMNELKVLNVTGMNFPSLPSSFLSLTNLQTLRLYQCNLSEIAIIRNLKKLDILSFQGSSIKQLPVEIAELTQLKLLDLSECYKLKVIPANVMSKLSRLEELYVGNSFCQWNVNGNAQLPELKNLSCLSALHVFIPDAQIMPKDLFSVKLGRYKIAIGNLDWDFSGCEASKALQLNLDTGIHLAEGIKMLVEKTEELRIEEFKGAENVLYELDREGFPHLKHLRVVNSSDMKCIIKSMGSASHKAFPVLESLELRELTVLEKICDGQLKTESFSRLKTVEVAGCDRLKYLFSVSIAKNLYQLQEIRVWKCENMKEIVVEEEGREENVVEFRQLRSLELRNLLKLKSFYSMEETPSLIGQGGSVSSTNMVPLFNGKVVFPAIKELVLESMSSIEKLWDDQLPAVARSFGFQNLSSLEVKSCHNLKNVFTSSMVKSFVQLKTLVVVQCEEMEEIITVSAKEERNNIMVFPKLESLDLYFLPNLKRFCYGINPIEFPVLRELRIFNCSLLNTSIVVFPAIKELVLESMSRIEKLWDDKLPAVARSFGFQNLSSLEVKSCHNLKNVFTSSMVKRFVQLKTLVVVQCEEMEEIITISAEEERNKAMVFPKLDYLYLDGLSNLRRFSCGINPIKFPVLRKLKITECPALSTFHCDSITNVGKSSNIISKDHKLQIDVPHCLFNDKVVLPAIKELVLELMSSIGKLWDDQLPAAVLSSVFQNLSNLEVGSCHKLKYVFPSSVVKSFVQLKTLVVRECEEMEEIIAVSAEEERNNRMVFPKLDSLELKRLHNLKRFCCGNPIQFPVLRELKIWICPILSTFLCDCTSVGNEARKSSSSNISIPKYLFKEKVALPMLQHLEIHSMENLERLWPNQLAEQSFSKLSYFELKRCNKLVNVFPLSMLTRLERLDKLIIWDCEFVEEIFEPQQADGSTAAAVFEFRRLTSLELIRLPKLKNFYHKMHSVNWPSLKEIEVIGCDKVEILFGFQETSGGKSEYELIPIQQLLFWVNNFTFPTLQQLTFRWNNGMKEIWHCYAQQQLQQQLLASHYFSKLKVVRLYDFPEQLAIFPSYLLHLLSFPNLEKLEICVAYFKEIFPSEGVGEEKPASAWLLLSRLTELRLKYLPELMHLWKEKEGCPKLKNNLVPSIFSFRNLVTLEVARCDGIIKLVAYSTAKSLLQLKEMKVWSCENIEEIIQGIGDDEDEAKEEISFPQLNLLELGYLPKLESFCSSGNYTFGFPSLVTVILENCPKMKMFSQGDSNTPLLDKVRLHDWGNEERWEGNLDSTVQQLFQEKVLSSYQVHKCKGSDSYFLKHCDFATLTPYQILVYGCHVVCTVPTTARGGMVYPSCLEHVPFYSNPCAEFHSASGYFWWPYYHYAGSGKLGSENAPHSFSCVEGLRPINPKDIEWKNGRMERIQSPWKVS
ncbi:uncharacterized protein LOC111277500 [Durio zibethinus]|uniref:Uncharacterized protein LOC111277500 n=1 Tax=Durio zibethinus TaxID=66656 RepID=A0A6P5WVI4_DURZI|nr:uncharacterized protein LOC111277500 [Durio zibethinus]